MPSGRPPAPARGRQTQGRAAGPGDDYIEVKDRIVEFYAKHADGRIVTEIVELGAARVTVRASVFRGPGGETAPAGVGHSFMAIPGSTPFTRGSELENAETSAVGRALAMAGISAHRGVSTSSEILAKRQDDQPQESHGEAPPRPDMPTDTSPTPAGDGDTSRALPVNTAGDDHPAVVDPETGEITGISKEAFATELRSHLIPVRTAHLVFQSLFPDQDSAKATPEQRLAVLNEAIRQATAKPSDVE